MLSNSFKISHTTKTKFFELKLFQTDQKIRQNCCRVDLESVLDPFTSLLSICVLTRGI